LASEAGEIVVTVDDDENGSEILARFGGPWKFAAYIEVTVGGAVGIVDVLLLLHPNRPAVRPQAIANSARRVIMVLRPSLWFFGSFERQSQQGSIKF